MEIFLFRKSQDGNGCSSVSIKNPGRTLDGIKYSFMVDFHIWLVADDVLPSLWRKTNRYAIDRVYEIHTSALREFAQQRFGLLQVRCVKAFGEPVVDF